MSGWATLSRVRALVLAIVLLQFAVLLVTGVVLFFVYRPSSSGAYGGLIGDDVKSRIDFARAMTTVHRSAARSAVPTAVIAGVLAAMGNGSSSRRRVSVLVGSGLALVTAVGLVTGGLLAWDQLGLWSVTVGNDMRGYLPIFDENQVRFVLIDGNEVAPATVLRWLFIHMVVVGGALGALLAVAWRRATRRRNRMDPDITGSAANEQRHIETKPSGTATGPSSPESGRARSSN